MFEPDLWFSMTGATEVVVSALELLSEVESADEALIPDEVKLAGWRLRAIVDEHVEYAE